MKRIPDIPQNLLDRAIAVVAPRMAVKRLQARTMLALAGGYTGARMDRASMSSWRSMPGGPEVDIVGDLPALRARSRDLARNAPIAAGAIGTQVSHVVGTGLSLSPAPDAAFLGLDEDAAEAWQVSTQREWKLWAESRDCDTTRQLNFYGIQRLAFRSALESGDVFVLTPSMRRPNRPIELTLQVIEADRVCNPNYAADSDAIVAGVERASVNGEAIAYHVVDRHPGEMRKRGSKWTRYVATGNSSGRRNVLHLFEPTRPGQVRGVPCLAPIIEPLKQLDRYTEAELQAAVTSGLFSVFVKMDPEAFTEMFDADAQETIVNQAKGWSGAMEAGKAINLLPGESIESANPGRPNAAFDPFVQSILQQVGMALEIPYEVLTMHFSSSYSAARAALLSAWRFFRARRDWLATYLCQPVYELFLDEAVASGRISAPGFFSDPAVRAAWCAAQWTGDGPGSIDPEKEVTAAQLRVDMGISTLAAESILYDGVDWDTKHRQRVKEEQARKEGGLTQPVSTTEPQPAKSDISETAVDDGDKEESAETDLEEKNNSAEIAHTRRR